MATLAVLAPAAAHNYHASGQPALVTSAGQNAFIGNNPYNTAGTYSELPFVRPSPQFEEADFRATAELVTGETMSPAQVSRFWAGQAVEHAKLNPHFAAQVLVSKLLLIVNDYEVPDNQDQYFQARYSPVLGALFLGFGLLLPFAAIGAAANLRSREVRFTIALLATYSLTLIAFFVNGRLRLPIIPLITVLSATGLKWLVITIAKHQTRNLALAAASAVLIGALAFHPPGYIDREANTALAWHNLGALQLRIGDTTSALDSYIHAAQILPNHQVILDDLSALRTDLGQFGPTQ